MTGLPLVTLGMPVRNGGELLRAALDSMVNQDYQNLQIIISDNASDDSTPDILKEYAARYPVMRVVRHEKPISAKENFHFVLSQAKGEFFAWCGHDDTRSTNFVSRLLRAFADPNTVLAFGDAYVWNLRTSPRLRSDYDFANDGLPLWRRLRKAALIQCFNIYGLWRIDALRRLDVCYARWWGDLPIMTGMAAKGVFRYVPGVAFNYYEVTRTSEERAQYFEYQPAAPLMVNLLDVCRGCFVTVTRVAGPFYGALTLSFVVEKFSRQIMQRMVLGFRKRRVA